MNQGGYDLVTASGDASLRLIAGGKVQPIDITRVASFSSVDPRLQNAAWHTVDGKHYGVPYQWGPNVLMYNTKVFKTAPTSWSVVFEAQKFPDGKPNKGRVQAFDGPIYIADAALYLMSEEARTRHHRPVRAHRSAVRGGARSAARAEAADPPLLARRHRADERLQERRRGRLRLLGLPGQCAAAGEAADRLGHPGRGRHRLGRHHHAARRRQALRTAPTRGWSGRSARRCRATWPHGSARCRRCPPPAPATSCSGRKAARPTASTTSTRSTSGVPRKPSAPSGECVPYSRWTQDYITIMGG